MLVAKALFQNLSLLSRTRRRLFSYLALAAPLVASNLLGPLAGLIEAQIALGLDLAYVGYVNFLVRCYFIFGVLLIAINGSASIKVNQLAGVNDAAGISRYLAAATILCFAASLIPLIAFTLWPQSLAHIYQGNTDQDTRLFTRIYGVTIALGAVCTPLSLMLMAHKKTGDVLMVAAASTTTHLALSFILSRHFGLPGIALGGLAAALIGATLQLARVKKLSKGRQVFDFKGISGEVFGFLWDKGKSIFVSQITLNVSNLLMVVMLSANASTVAVYALYFSTLALFQSTALALGSASSILVGRSLGKRRSYAITLSRAIILYAFACGVVTAMVSPLIFTLAFISLPAVPAAAIALASVEAALVMISANLGKGILRSGGDVRYLRNVTLSLQLACRLPIAFAVVGLIDDQRSLLIALLALNLVCTLSHTTLVVQRARGKSWIIP